MFLRLHLQAHQKTHLDHLIFMIYLRRVRHRLYLIQITRRIGASSLSARHASRNSVHATSPRSKRAMVLKRTTTQDHTAVLLCLLQRQRQHGDQQTRSMRTTRSSEQAASPNKRCCKAIDPGTLLLSDRPHSISNLKLRQRQHRP